MNYIDCHFHLDLMENSIQVAERIERSKTYTIAVTNTPSVFFHTYNICSNKRYLRAAIGMHPELVVQRKSEMSLFMEELSKTRYVGEIGLDKYRKSAADYAVQKKIFEEILHGCAVYGDKILTVHSRWAAADVISMIGDKFPGKVILHWFSGTVKELERAVLAGFYFSVNYAMTQSENGRRIIQAIPSSQLLTETDGPFVSIEGIPSTPTEIKSVIEQLTRQSAFSLRPVELQTIIFNNFHKLIGSV